MSKSPWVKDFDFNIKEIFSDDEHYDRSAEQLASEEIDLTESADSYLEGYEAACTETINYTEGYKEGFRDGLQENKDDAFEEGLRAAVNDVALTPDEAKKIVDRFWSEEWWLSEVNGDLSVFMTAEQIENLDMRMAKLLMLVSNGDRRHDNIAGMYDPKDIEDAD